MKRINNLKTEDKERVLSGDIRHFKKLLEEEYEASKEILVDCPLNKVEELRGKCALLREIIKLLP